MLLNSSLNRWTDENTFLNIGGILYDHGRKPILVTRISNGPYWGVAGRVADVINHAKFELTGSMVLQPQVLEIAILHSLDLSF